MKYKLKYRMANVSGCYACVVLLHLSALVFEATADDALQVAFREWKLSSLDTVEQTFVVTGTGERDNPLRRQLRTPFRGAELFVHFRMTYDVESVDTPGRWRWRVLRLLAR